MIDDSEGCAGFLIGVVIATIFMAGIPMKCAKHDQRQEAVDHNAASWVVDQKTGETTFKWKDEVK